MIVTLEKMKSAEQYYHLFCFPNPSRCTKTSGNLYRNSTCTYKNIFSFIFLFSFNFAVNIRKRVKINIK